MKHALTILWLSAVAGTAAADVVFLKSGQRLEGTLTPAPGGYELTNDLGTWPIAKADVVRIVPAFEALMRDAETAHAQARALYAEALKIEGDVKAANARLRQGVELLRKAADLHNLALETYTDPKYGDLSKPMTKLFQEMRIYRDKMHSENAPPAAPPRPAPPPVVAAPKPAPKPAAPAFDPAAALAKALAGDVEAMVALGSHHDDRAWASAEAEKWLRAAADKNHPTALFRLGRLHRLGKGVRQDLKEAQRWFLKADAAGSGLGRAALARLEAAGALGPRDLEKAWDWGQKAIDDLERLAADGDADALLALAWIHREGLGRLQDLDRALDYYKTAAGRPSARALTELGIALRDGLALKKDRAEAKALFAKAAEMGWAEAQVCLGEMHDAFTGWKNEEPPEFVRAGIWYRKAADQGHGRALYRLAVMHLDGKGVEKNPAEAAKLFAQAEAKAQDDFLKSLLNDLGYIHEKGLGVRRNPSSALKYYRMSADLGSPEALYNLGAISLESNKERDALKYFTDAARRGHAGAQNNLAVFYASGRAVRKNLLEAEKWFLMAAQGGDAAAADNLKKLQRERKK